MKKVVPILFIVLYALFCFSCQIGLGEEVDLEAPILNLKTMISGETEIDSSHFGGGLYCRKNVIFKGVATDNKAVEKVYAEIKWSDQEDFSYYADAILEGDNFTFNFNLEKQGVAYIKFVVTDKSKNFGIKSSKVVTLLVDEDAPVASAWYIDRNLNGIRYSLKTLEELKAIDFDLQENKDAAQNVAFSIHSSFKDVMGIKPGSISIQIKDENQKTICVVPNSITNDYAPKFEITEEMLVAADSSLKSGIHYLQVWYNAEDVVTIPESNKAQDVQVEGGWFIWWPESDNPKVTQKPVVDEVSKSILLNVSEAVTVTVFDDDSIKEAYCALLTESEYALIKDSYKTDPAKLLEVVPDAEKSARTVKSEPSTTKRDEVFTFVAPKSPQVMYLAYYVKDSGGKITTAYHVVNVTDATSPILYIASPSNNEIPSVEMKNDNKNAFVTVTGQTIDTSGCTYLEFVWVPDVVETDNVKKSTLAKNFLNSLNTDGAHNTYAPKENDNVKVSEVSNLKVWSVKLGKEENTENGYKKQDFKFTMDLLNDFICNGNNEKNNNKFFVVKVTRKDGKNSVQEYKLSADNLPPVIKSITPETKTQIVESTKDYVLEFKAEKTNKVAIDTSKYAINQSGTTPPEKLGSYDSSTKTYKYTIPKTTLEDWEKKTEKPVFIFAAADIFGNSVSSQYTLIISNLPQLKSITSPAPQNCNLGQPIQINANFSSAITLTDDELKDSYILLTNIKNDSSEKESKAVYKSGAGSQTIIFEYIPEEGDYTDTGINVGVKYEYDTETTCANNLIQNCAKLKDGENVHLNTLLSSSVLNGKQIKVDAVSPKVDKISISEGKKALKAGETVTVTATFTEPILVQGSPTLILKVGSADFELNLESSTSDTITFKGTVTTGLNGNISYSDKCITGAQYITDNYQNVLITDDTQLTESDYVIDTIPPVTPTVKNSSGNELLAGNYKTKVDFVVAKSNTDTDISKYEYSLDGGVSWNECTNTNKGSVTQSSAQLCARVTDNAGNVSLSSEPIKLEIESSFPNYNVECMTSDGYYSTGKTITFRVTFDKKINITDQTANITFDGKTATIVSSIQDAVSYAEFEYTVKSTDDFNLGSKSVTVNLIGIEDSFGFTGGTSTATINRPNVVCDGVAPTATMIPGTANGDSVNYVINGNNVYSQGNKIKITFSEPVQKGRGNIILRQTAGWAIPPVLSAEEFNTICNKLSYEDKNKLARQDINGKFEEDMEDTGVGIKHDNNQYHGTGQFIGPYKKSMQGIDNSNNPDISTKFVLDFEIDIWETTQTHPVGKTFTPHTDNKADAIPITPNTTTSAGELRAVLEKAGLHQRVLDVTSASVEIDITNPNIAYVTFPAGLIDKTDDLPLGREWELVIEEGAFLDMAGNSFGENNASSKTEVKINTENGETFFNSDGVAMPVIRVDRYSYGLGIKQSDVNGDLTSPIDKDSVKPTGYVRVRIDCETKDATVNYGVSSVLKDTNVFNNTNPGASKFDNNGANTCYTITAVSRPTIFNTPYNSDDKVFALGSGDYKKSYKAIVGAKATKPNHSDSAVGYEGIFQTVVYMKDPKFNGNNSCAISKPYWNNNQNKLNGTDVSIRGTTGMAGEPYISPFPLRDSRVGSPYLRIIFNERASQTAKTSVDYYWVSYEVLVWSSLSNYSWHKDGFYDWAQNWGVMYPGEFSRVENMKNWG